jgi:hypothetical protein
MIKTNDSFGIHDLSSQRNTDLCPIKNCNVSPESNGKFSICPRHGLELHKTTYVYYNGNNAEDKKKALLRNILPCEKSFMEKRILGNKQKAESYRLGYENSEDALTWNIFASLSHFHRLHNVYNNLTGETANENQLKMILWGLEIDFDGQLAKQRPSLIKVRNQLEPDIKRFKTEPDIMILGPTHLICIEAKFTSGNPIAIDRENGEGEKPKSREGLINRYICKNKLWKTPVINPEDIGEKVHSQLLRMLVFTSTMAQLENRDWIVANLTSRTQWANKQTRTNDYDYNDPTSSIPINVRNKFRFISWEKDIYEKVIKKDTELKEVSKYMQEKTANLKKAFDISM